MAKKTGKAEEVLEEIFNTVKAIIDGSELFVGTNTGLEYITWMDRNNEVRTDAIKSEIFKYRILMECIAVEDKLYENKFIKRIVDYVLAHALTSKNKKTIYSRIAKVGDEIVYNLNKLFGIDLGILVGHGPVAVADGDQGEAELVEVAQAVIGDVPAQHAVPDFIVLVADVLPLLRGEVAEGRQIAVVLLAHGFQFLQGLVDLRTLHNVYSPFFIIFWLSGSLTSIRYRTRYGPGFAGILL